MDTFPEVFRRFEMDVDTDRIRSFNQLKSSFGWWAGRHWKGSDKQVEALKREARRLNRSRPWFRQIRIPRKPHVHIRAYRNRGAFQREILRRHYTVVKYKSGKTRVVARIPKGKAGAGRFA